MLKLDSEVVILCHFEVSVCNFAFAETHQHLKVTSRKPDICVIQLIGNVSPPLRVVRFIHKLLKFVLLSELGYLLTFNTISLVIVKVIPLLWYISISQQNFFIRAIVTVSQIDVVFFLEILPIVLAFLLL